MKVLVINCGSSSLKYQLIDSETESVLAKGLCERIGIDGALTHQPAGKDKIKSTPAMPDHKTAIGIVIDQLTDKENGVVESLDEIGAVGHRIVHGGEKFTKSCLITDEVIKEVEECSVFAPLHNPAGLIGVRACQELNKTASEVLNILNKESGVYGLSGVSSDFRDVKAARAEGNKVAAAALDAYAYRVAKYIGAYTAAMNGVDAIAFTAGLGENDDITRKAICEYLGYLGTELDEVKNDVHGETAIISTDDSKVTLLCVPTNEELMIARDTVALVK